MKNYLNIYKVGLTLLLIYSILFSSVTAKPHIISRLRGEIFYGKASWYGGKFHGRTTANGEKYNKNRLTAAHKTLPFGTKVRVTNLKNNKSVVVKINDRGPFKPGRILDLSEKAAKKIGSRQTGIADVKVQIIKKGDGQRYFASNRRSGKLRKFSRKLFLNKS